MTTNRPRVRARAGRRDFLPKRKRTRAAPSDRSPSRWQRAWPPLSTGCPGPFHAQPPIQPDERRRSVQPFGGTPRPRGRLDASALCPGAALNVTSLQVRLTSPVLDLISNLPSIAAMSTAMGLRTGKVRSHSVTTRGNVSAPFPASPTARHAARSHVSPLSDQERIFVSPVENIAAAARCASRFRGMDSPTWRLRRPARTSAANPAAPLPEVIDG